MSLHTHRSVNFCRLNLKKDRVTVLDLIISIPLSYQNKNVLHIGHSTPFQTGWNAHYIFSIQVCYRFWPQKITYTDFQIFL